MFLSPSTAHLCSHNAWSHFVIFRSLQLASDSYTFRLTPTLSGSTGEYKSSIQQDTVMLNTGVLVSVSCLFYQPYFLVEIKLPCVFVSLQASVTNSDLIFLKLHAPWDVLCRYAELMNIRMPFR